MNKIKSIERISISNKFIRTLWNFSCFLFFRPFGSPFFRIWRVLLLKLFGAKIEWDSGVYSSVKIWAPWNLVMGHNAWMGPNVICYNQGIVEIGHNVTISQNTHLCTAGHDINYTNNPKTGLVISDITINNNVWVAADAFIGMGVTIGEGAVVGARAAVFKDVAPWTVVGGNPAKYIKDRVIKDK